MSFSSTTSRRQWLSPRGDVKADTTGLQKVLSIFPKTIAASSTSAGVESMSWYLQWLDQQRSLLPPQIIQLFARDDIPAKIDAQSSTTSTIASSAGPLASETSVFVQIFLAVAEYAKTNPNTSIEEIVTHLTAENGILAVPDTITNITINNTTNGSNDDPAAELYIFTRNIRNLIFAILGWQTMLYTPEFGVTPENQFAIADSLDGYDQGFSFISLKQPHANSEYDSKIFLKGFGLLMPPPNTCFSEDPAIKAAFDSTSVLCSLDLNYSLLREFAGVKIKWIDNIAPHLEFDNATGTLFLFKFPSFCEFNAPAMRTSKLGVDEMNISDEKVDSVFRSFADFSGTETNWMSESDTSAYLREILLSYRFLFGQDKSSRKAFRDKERSNILTSNNNFIYPTHSNKQFHTNTASYQQASNQLDPLLDTLCSRKTYENAALIGERETYRLHRDFPFLRARLVILKRELSIRKPRSWRELWRDKRDTGNWYTFWAVVFIGGLGLLFAALQTALALVQVLQARND